VDKAPTFPRPSFAQSCSVPSLRVESRSPEPTATASLAQVAMRWQVQRECQVQPRAPAVLKVAEAIPGVQPPSAPGGATRLADFKPILTDLFDEGGQSNQSPQQLQAKIEQLQRLQQLLQKQQEGLKRQNQRQRQTPQGWVLWPKQSSLLLASGARGASQGSEAVPLLSSSQSRPVRPQLLQRLFGASLQEFMRIFCPFPTTHSLLAAQGRRRFLV
ncbi:unnamed protein product, partial [Effrenium voratum]